MSFHGNKGREYLERSIVKNVTENQEGRSRDLKLKSLMILDKALKLIVWIET